jgi:hypothetical protein
MIEFDAQQIKKMKFKNGDKIFVSFKNRIF